jgi:hypothetical protein
MMMKMMRTMTRRMKTRRRMMRTKIQQRRAKKSTPPKGNHGKERDPQPLKVLARLVPLVSNQNVNKVKETSSACFSDLWQVESV